MTKDVILTLPWPPTVNTYYRHVGPRVLISKDGRKYRENVKNSVFAHRPLNLWDTLTGRLSVEIVANPPDRRKRDLDNLLKGLLDSLQHAGIYQDDSQIDKLSIKRSAVSPGGSIYVRLEEL